ncbi:hypothetical protein EVB27_129 [Rhizobium phage RHph_TM16]|nr:hypothetical protein EVB27_129 [Rhizobium phage RHph_TM16]
MGRIRLRFYSDCNMREFKEYCMGEGIAYVESAWDTIELTDAPREAIEEAQLLGATEL